MAKTAKKTELLDEKWMVPVEDSSQQHNHLPAELMAEYAATDDEMEDLKDAKIRLKRIKFDGRDGLYYDLDTDEEIKELTGVVLAVMDGGVLYGDPGNKQLSFAEEDWICRLPAGKRLPVINEKYSDKAKALGCGDCSKCSLKAWVNNEPPLCNEKKEVIFYDSALRQPIAISLGGTSLANVRKALEQVKRTGFPAFAFVASLSAEEREKGRQQWYAATVTVDTTKAIAIDHFRQFRELRQQWVSYYKDGDGDREFVEAEAVVVSENRPAQEEVDLPEASIL